VNKLKLLVALFFVLLLVGGGVLTYFYFPRCQERLVDQSAKFNIQVTDAPLWKQFTRQVSPCPQTRNKLQIILVDDQQRNVIGLERTNPDFSYAVSQDSGKPVIKIQLETKNGVDLNKAIYQAIIWGVSGFDSPKSYELLDFVSKSLVGNIGVKISRE